MHVIEIIPLSKSAYLNTLSYYSATPYGEGTLVKIPLRKKEAKGMVISSTPVSRAKTAVRAATFSLRKLAPDAKIGELPQPIIDTVFKLTENHPESIATILVSLLPKEVVEGTYNLPEYKQGEESENPYTSLLQGDRDRRYQVYRKRIRENFAHLGSVMFVVPTSADVYSAYEDLKTGIEDRIVTFTPTHGKKTMERAYRDLNDLSHAKLIITTPSYIGIDRHDITQVIVDQCRSPYYKSKTKPYLDAREIINILAKNAKRNVIMGDILPRTEDEHKRREDIYATEDEHPKRLSFNSSLSVIEQTDEPDAKEPFHLFSDKLKEAINETLRKKRNVFLLAARRGLAPVVACGDCGYIFRCPDSGAPYSLFLDYKDGEERRWFYDSASGKKVRAEDTCSQCGSWRLREKGIGIQYIYKDLKNLYPEKPIFLFDHTTVKTHKQAISMTYEFYRKKGAILLATPMVFPYLDKLIQTTAVVSYDATRTMPTWRAEEELLGTLLFLREKTKDTLYIQTRNEPDPLLDYLSHGQVEKFYTDEIALRKQLGYPPFAIFIHLTFKGSPDKLASTERMLENYLKPYKAAFYQSPILDKQEKIGFGLIRVPSSKWPDQDLLLKLKELPPSIRIEINPDKII